MALSETEHPFGQELSTVVQAVELGLCDSPLVPPHISLSYRNPFETPDGTIVIAMLNKREKNLSVISVPILSGFDPKTRVINQNGVEPTYATIVVADTSSEGFEIPIKKQAIYVEALQFDVYDEGIVFSALHQASRISVYGVYEGEIYDDWARTAREQTGLGDVRNAASRFLADAA